jgi:hypothetical protein
VAGGPAPRGAAHPDEGRRAGAGRNGAGRRLAQEWQAAAARRDLAAARQSVAQAQSTAAEAAGLAKPAPGRPAAAPDLTPGSRLWSVPLASWVTVVAAPEPGGKVRVERNGIRVELPVSALRAAPNESAAATDAPAAGPRHGPRLGPPAAVDRVGVRRRRAARTRPVRGRAWSTRCRMASGRGGPAGFWPTRPSRLESFMDGASHAGQSEVRIIHGKGTGALRTAVTRWLTGRAGIASYRLGEAWEGSTGVTVARLE